MSAYKQGKRIGRRVYVYVAIVVIIALIIAVVALPKAGVRSISSAESFEIRNGSGIYFTLQGGNSIYTIYLENSTNNAALIYEAGLPLLSEPVAEIYLSAGQAVNVSSNQSGIADINVMLVSANSSWATVKISPISYSLGIRQSKSVMVLPQVAFSENVISAHVPITTIPSTSSVSTTTTTSTPTTIISSSTPTAQIIAFINSTTVGQLMNNYNKLYDNDSGCTGALYNTTFISIKGSAPTGIYAFSNVSKNVPSKITENITELKSNTFGVLYSQITPSSSSTGKLIDIVVNTGTSPYTIESTTFEDLWTGQNVTIAQNAYNFAVRAGNACAAYMLQAYAP